MTSVNSKLLNLLRDELFIHTNCYGCDTIYIYHMARAFMAFAYTCDVHNLKIRSHDLVFCVCSCRTTCHRVRDICRRYWNDKVSLLQVLSIYTVTYKPIITNTRACIQHTSLQISYSCAPDWLAIDGFGLVYNWYLMAFGFFVPTVIVISSNIGVYYVTRKVR